VYMNIFVEDPTGTTGTVSNIPGNDISDSGHNFLSYDDFLAIRKRKEQDRCTGFEKRKTKRLNKKQNVSVSVSN